MMLRAGAWAVLSIMLWGCGARAESQDVAALVAQMNADHRTIRTDHGNYRAVSSIEVAGSHTRIRTDVVGDRRDEIGDAVRIIYDTTRRRVRDGGYRCAVNGGFDAPMLTWNGSRLSCSLVTVEF
jgi:hypothetical protein